MTFINHERHFSVALDFSIHTFFVMASLTIFALFNNNAFANTTPSEEAWLSVEQKGAKQDVYFHAWGGDQQINNYIQWVGEQVKQQYQIDLHHVKLTDTSEAVSRVLAEKSANNHDNGQVDLVWINGANFASMAKNHLLAPHWVEQLPNFSLTNPTNNPAMTRDFGVPTQGMEAPWGQAALTFYYDSLKVTTPPQTLPELLTWSKQHPGRFTYPKPPEFLGMSFLKYALIILTEQQPENIKNKLYQPVTAKSQAELLPNLWKFLDELHPYLWRKGKPEIPSAISRFDLPDSTRTYRMRDGSLSNIHFVAIPYNAAHLDSAKLVANFLLSPEAQAKKQQTAVWGDNSTLDLSQLSPSQKSLFAEQGEKHASSNIINIDNTRLLSELHPSWVKAITEQWLNRYGVQ